MALNREQVEKRAAALQAAFVEAARRNEWAWIADEFYAAGCEYLCEYGGTMRVHARSRAEIKATLIHGVPNPQGGERKNFRGILDAVEGEGAEAKAKLIVDGQPWLIPISDVDVAKVVPDWDEVMKGGRGQVRQQADTARKSAQKN